MKVCTKRTNAFTLIELLIVVAIIAILAAIAVPNFLEAQTRAKISRVKADMRALATGIESYAVDNNEYVWGVSADKAYSAAMTNDSGNVIGGFFSSLSSPVAYFTNPYLIDPFVGNFADAEGSTDRYLKKYVKYITYSSTGRADRRFNSGSDWSGSYVRGDSLPADRTGSDTKARSYVLFSYGPSKETPMVDFNGRERHFFTDPQIIFENPDKIPEFVCNEMYDPTNGTVSNGIIHRAGGAGTVAQHNYQQHRPHPLFVSEVQKRSMQ
ncbi:MAG: prepilin-type N-terminal cleavage/methylation domain-containing protein [Candidatus Sumerlaeia bacterium]